MSLNYPTLPGADLFPGDDVYPAAQTQPVVTTKATLTATPTAKRSLAVTGLDPKSIALLPVNPDYL